MSKIKIIRLKSGEEILGKVIENDDHIVIKKPSIIIPTGREQLALAQWLPYCSVDNGIEIKNDYIVFMVDPMPELLNQYNQVFGSGLVVPTSEISGVGVGIQGSNGHSLKLTT